jgi:hypothetical protein
MMNKLHGKGYLPMKTLEEAKKHVDGAVVLEGDWGGTVYATCPVKYINATHDEIVALCQDLEKTFWGCNVTETDQGGWGVYYEVKKPGSGVWGGMGGGCVLDGLWVHDDLDDATKDDIKNRLKLSVPDVD